LACDEHPSDIVVADEVLGDEHLVIVADTHGATVEQLVVQTAEAEPVIDGVRSSEGPPADVRRIQTCELAPQPGPGIRRSRIDTHKPGAPPGERTDLD